MPDSTMSAALAEAYACAPSDRVILHTLELQHPSFEGGAIRVVRDSQDLTATIEAGAYLNAGQAVSFWACGFDFDMPETNEATTPSLTVTIDNVDKRIIEAVQASQANPQPTYMIYRPYLSTDTSAPHINPPIKLSVTDIRATNTKITATARFANLSNRKFPGETYTTTRFPGLSS